MENENVVGNQNENIVNEKTNDELMQNNEIEQLKKEINGNNKLVKKLKRKNLFKNIIISILSFLTFIFFTMLCVTILYLNGSLLKYVNKFNKQHLPKDVIATESQINSTYLQENNIAKKISQIDSILKQLFYYPIDDKEVETGLFKGMINALNDKYAEYMPPAELDSFVESNSGEYVGIGAMVGTNPQTKDNLILNVMEGSPAEKYNVQNGDVFIAIDGENVEGLEINELVSKVKGEEGSTVHIKFYRPSINDYVELDIVRGRVESKIITSKMLDDKTGYIGISQFDLVADKQFEESCEDLLEEGMEKLVIDLRSNPGGNLETVLNMLDYILPDNLTTFTRNNDDFESGKTLLVYTKDRVSINETYYCEDKHELNIPITVLTNDGSASASELFSQTLKDYGYAQIVGDRTYGKGVVQQLIPLQDGSAIKFTVSEYFTPSSYSIQDKGVIPNYGLEVDGKKIIFDGDAKNILNEKYVPKEETVKLLYPEGALDLNEAIIKYASESEAKYQNKIATTSNINDNFQDRMMNNISYIEEYKEENNIFDTIGAIDYQLCKAYEVVNEQATK